MLGFVEGEASFSIHPRDLSPIFSITQFEVDLNLMEAIRDFIKKLPGLELKHKESNIGLYFQKITNANQRNKYQLKISDLALIRDVLIPSFDSLIWHSKKEKDYQD